MPVIDEKLLEQGRSPCGGWNAAQLRCLNVEWTHRKPKGYWIKEALGKRITPQAAQQFVALRGQCKDAKSRWKNIRKELKLDPQRKALVEQLAEQVKFRIAHWPKHALQLLVEDGEFLERITQAARDQISAAKKRRVPQPTQR